MFNALTPEDLLVGIGRVLRLVAGASGALEEYERSQTLSAYSVTRLLAAEEAAAAELLARTTRELEAVLAGAARPAVALAVTRIGSATDGVVIGDALSELLRGLERSDPLRSGLHAVLARMIDDEVAALAAARR